MYIIFKLRRFLKDKAEFDRIHPHGHYDGAPSVIIQGGYASYYPQYGQPNQYPVPPQPAYSPYEGPEYRAPIN